MFDVKKLTFEFRFNDLRQYLDPVRKLERKAFYDGVQIATIEAFEKTEFDNSSSFFFEVTPKKNELLGPDWLQKFQFPVGKPRMYPNLKNARRAVYRTLKDYMEARN